MRVHGEGVEGGLRVALALLGVIVVVLLTASAARAEFGIHSFSANSFNADGTVDNQAGDHPYASIVEFEFNSRRPGLEDGDVKDITVDLPPGFIGNPTAMPTCARAALALDACSAGTQVGIVELDFARGTQVFRYTDTVFNVTRTSGEAADFAFEVLGVPVHIVSSLRPGDLGVKTTLTNIPDSEPIVGSRLTLWGVPADPRHDAQRGRYFSCGQNEGRERECSDYNEELQPVAGNPANVPAVSFLTNPTLCGGPLDTRMQADSWQDPGRYVEASSTTATGVTGCEKLSFEPSISLSPDVRAAGAPTGLSVHLSVPQSSDPDGLATATLRGAVVQLPPGLAISSSGAGGLASCSDAQIGIATEAVVACPSASKIGEVTIVTPLLAEPLAGPIFLGAQESDDPTSGKEFRVFLDAENPDYGISVRLEGGLKVDPATGQMTAVFEEDPQLPFSDLTLNFKGGARAPLAFAAQCGVYTTKAALTPWATDDAAPTNLEDSFDVSLDGNGAACPATMPFAPAFSAGTVEPRGGGYSPFTLTLTRGDQDQALGAISVHTPPGLLGVLKSVTRCPEPQASLGTCDQQSSIGHTTVGAGPGSNPFYLGGQVFLTGPYKGAPFGLSIVVPAVAGPFNLGTVVVRAQVAVDPKTAALSISSDPLPTILEGVPLDLRTVNVTVDRPGFMFNPTNCASQTVNATVSSAQGATAGLANHFQAADCATLAFKPKLTASTQGHASFTGNGASLDVKIAAPKQGPGGNEANIAKVDVQLPKLLPSRLKTLQLACSAGQFAANPGGCPAASDVGTAVASTPILAQPLRGPAYLVSHGGAAFPDLVFVLQGEGITIDLTGNTFISKAGVTSSKFEAVPDTPISSFELKLPEGKYSVLGSGLKKAKASLCGQSLVMPTTIVAQNGAVLKQSTKVAISGCKAKSAKSSKGSKSESKTKTKTK